MSSRAGPGVGVGDRRQGCLCRASALLRDPRTEPVAIVGVAERDAGVTVAFDVVQESAEALLPLGGVRVPCPAGQLLEFAFAVGVEGAFVVPLALRRDPLAEVVPRVVDVPLWDSGTMECFDIPK